MMAIFCRFFPRRLLGLDVVTQNFTTFFTAKTFVTCTSLWGPSRLRSSTTRNYLRKQETLRAIAHQSRLDTLCLVLISEVALETKLGEVVKILLELDWKRQKGDDDNFCLHLWEL